MDKNRNINDQKNNTQKSDEKNRGQRNQNRPEQKNPSTDSYQGSGSNVSGGYEESDLGSQDKSRSGMNRDTSKKEIEQ